MGIMFLYYQDLHYTSRIQAIRSILRTAIHGVNALRLRSIAARLEQLDVMLYKPAGLNHQLANLGTLFSEAASLGRVAVVAPPNLAPVHNFGRFVGNSWETYVDLLNSRVSVGGRCISPAWQRADDFDFGRFARRHVLKLKQGERINDAQNAAYPLIVRDFRLRIGRFWADMVDVPDLSQIEVHFVAARNVQNLAAAVASRLESFCAVHVRRGDRLKLHPTLADATRPERILVKLRTLVPTGDNLYISTDEWRQDYFEPLRAEYQVYQYFDFDGLVTAREADNYLLYAIEKEIFDRAHTRVFTFRRSDGLNEHYLCEEEGWT